MDPVSITLRSRLKRECRGTVGVCLYVWIGIGKVMLFNIKVHVNDSCALMAGRSLRAERSVSILILILFARSTYK